MISLTHYLVLSAILFVLGLAIIAGKRHVLARFMGVEFILTAANLNLVAFSRYGIGGVTGQTAVLFLCVLAAVQAGVAVPIFLALYRRSPRSDSDSC